jgi:hypothetical protein
MFSVKYELRNRKAGCDQFQIPRYNTDRILPTREKNKIAMDRKSVPKVKIKLRVLCGKVERRNIRTLSVVLETVREFKT